MSSLLALLLAAAALPCPSGPALGDDPIVLKVDEKTKMPLGPMVAPHGKLLDPRDLPEPVLPHLALAEGLQGFDQSLTALFARNLGFVVERKKLDRVYQPHALAVRDDWNENLGELVALLDAEDPDAWVTAALWQDTGRHLSEDFSEIRIEAPPRIRFVPLELERFRELTRLEQRIAALGPEMPKEDAEALHALLLSEEVESADPWFLHARSQLMLLSFGGYSKDLVENNPFGITPEEFFSRCRKALTDALIDARVPALPAEIGADSVFFFEGWTVVRFVPKAELKSAGEEAAWRAPDELPPYNAATHRPLLLFEVPEAARFRAGSRFPKARISLVVGGEERELYEGKWPLP